MITNIAEPETIHSWFGLTYSNYLVLPRSVLQSMPNEWQARFVGCLRELEDTYGGLDWPTYHVQALIREPEHITPYVECPACKGDGSINGGYCPECGGEEEIADPEGSRYETPEEVGFRTDPIPSYNRGRTRVEPKAFGED